MPHMPVASRDGENGGVNDKIYLLGRQAPGRFRLAPKIDAHRKTQAAEVRVPGWPVLPGADLKPPALQVTQVMLR